MRYFPVILSCLLVGLHGPGWAWDGGLASGHDLRLDSQQLSSAAAGRDLQLQNTTISGKLSAGRNIRCQGCDIQGAASAGRDVQLEACKNVARVSAGRNVFLSDTRVDSHVSSGQDILLDQARVAGSVRAGNGVKARDSIIQGTVSIGGHALELWNTQTGDVRFAGQSDSSSSSIHINRGVMVNSIQGSGVSINGGNVQIRGGGHSSYATLGRNSVSSINGYLIKSTHDQTTLITPGQTVYINGQKVSGEGPETYAEYQEVHPAAPTVQAPGWASRPDLDSLKPKNSTLQQEVVNVLELKNNSVVNGSVIFESGYGKVVVYPGSQLKGEVTNGFVERIN